MHYSLTAHFVQYKNLLQTEGITDSLFVSFEWRSAHNIVRKYLVARVASVQGKNTAGQKQEGEYVYQFPLIGANPIQSNAIFCSLLYAAR